MKNHFFYTAILLSLGLLTFQCVSNFDPKITENDPKLVVDGLITNQPGPYRITLQYSVPYTNRTSVSSVSGAVIEISDDKGNKERLTERQQGIYETAPNGIRGIVGRSYTIHITTPNGKKYQSKPELLKPVAAFGKISAKYQDTKALLIRGFLYLYIDVQDPMTPNDFYRWKWTHYKKEEYCFVAVSNGPTGLIRTRSKCCEPCWEIQPCNGCIFLANDRLTNGKTITSVPIGTIPYNDTTPYFINFEQYSLTPEAYQFWQSVENQTSNSGGIFDLPPATITGNIICTSHPEEQSLGYFGASALVYQAQYIARNNIPVQVYDRMDDNWIDLNQCVKCQESLFRTPKQPMGW
jgi:Domain of unknown function (DUF4249)